MKGNAKLIRFNIFFIIGLIIVVVFVYLNIEQVNKKNSIVGRWYGSSNQIEMEFTLLNNYHCVFLTKDLSTGKISNVEGMCSVDFTKAPHPLDINDTNKGSLYTIIDFISLDTIRIARFSKKWRLRPISFNENDLILTRMHKE